MACALYAMSTQECTNIDAEPEPEVTVIIVKGEQEVNKSTSCTLLLLEVTSRRNLYHIK